MASSAPQVRILVSVATYNERDNLSPLLHAIHEQLPTADVLVIDDNSPDGTGKLADEIAATDARVHVLHRQGKLGLGTAILAGMDYAIKHDYDYLINMDADFSHHPRHLPALVAGMERKDVMIGSRYVAGGGVVDWPLSRRLMSQGVNAAVRLLMRIPARDTSGSYRCYRVSKLREAQLERVMSRGYSFQQEMLYRCRKVRCRLGEVPIIFENRRAGASKVNSHEAIRSLSVIFLIGLKAFFGFEENGRQPSRPRKPPG